MKTNTRNRCSTTARTKTQLAALLGCSRVTLWRLLALPGAPGAKRGRFDVAEVRSFMEQHAPTAGAPMMLWNLRVRKLRVETETAEREAAIARRELIPADEIRSTIPRLVREFAEELATKFVRELPSRYKGRDTVEIAQMNQAALDTAIERFRSGALAVAADKTPSAPRTAGKARAPG